MTTTPPRRNAVTSMPFTPYILKTASTPTSAKLLQAAALDQDLKNELTGAAIEEPQWTPNSDDVHYVLHFYECFQSQTRVEVPKLSELKDDQVPLYDITSNCWQPILIPHILRLRTPSARRTGNTNTTSTADSEGQRTSEDDQPQQKSGSRSLTITRTVEDTNKELVTEVEQGNYFPTAGSEEEKVASWLNRIVASARSSQSAGLQTRSKTRVLADVQRNWSAQFSTRPAPTDVDIRINLKPDIALLQKDPFDPDGSYTWRHAVSFLELTSSEDNSRMRKQIARKAYAIFVSQPGRRFVIALSITQLQFRLHLFDRAGVVHSSSYHIHRHADHFLRVLCGLAFAPDELVGYDPTLFFSPVIARSPQLHTPATIQVGKVTYIITSLLFSSDLIRGRGTLCFAVRRPTTSKHYVVKASWVRDTRAVIEEQMLSRIKKNGLTYGLPTLVVAWTVKIGGVDDSTAIRRPDYIQSHLSQDQHSEVRIHRRLLLEPVGIPLEKFSCAQELVSVLIDIVDGEYYPPPPRDSTDKNSPRNTRPSMQDSSPRHQHQKSADVRL